jgi:hypothetical protein
VKLRKLVMGAAAIALPLGVMSTVVGTGAAFAAAKAQPGTLVCASITGTVTFNPPLTVTAQTVITTTKTTLKNCTPTGGGLKPKSGVSTSSTSTANENCASLETGSTTPFTLKTKWAPATKIKPTFSTVSGISPATDGSGNAGFQLPNTGGTTSGTGSYLGSDGGKSGSAQAFTSKTAAQIGATCTGATGLATLTITHGMATFA